MSWMELFRAGKHTDAAGNERLWTQADLRKIAQQYNDGDHEAPIVVGHPKDNAPAYGWIKALRVTGEVLEGLPKQVNPAFAELVREGAYKKRSISLYPDLSLRHVGFLGAMPPAVKGLKDVSFNDGQEGSGAPLVLEFATPANFEETMKQYLLLADGRVFDTKGGKIIPANDPAYLAWVKAGNEPEGDEKEPADHADLAPKTSPKGSAKKAPRVVEVTNPNPEFAELSEREKELTDRMAKMEAQTRLDKARSFAEKLVAQGKLVPAQTKGLAEYMAATEGLGVMLEFSEGKKPGAEWLRDFLEGLPKRGHLESLGQGAASNFTEDDKAGMRIAEMSGFGPKKP